MRLLSLLAAAALACPTLALAQATDSLDLHGRSTIVVGFGLTGSRDALASASGVTTHTSGEVGSLSFRHFVTPQAAIEITTALLRADVTAAADRAEANTIVPLVFGVRFAPRAFALGPSLRPYISAGAGPYMHTTAQVFAAAASDQTETAPGARLAAGADWLAGRHFVMESKATSTQSDTSITPMRSRITRVDSA